MITAQEISEATGLPTYEQMKEWCEANTEGRLLILPCKVGQEVYRLSPGCCDHRNKDRCTTYCDGWDYTCPDYEAELEVVSGRFVVSDYPDFGKTVFLTRAEAESALWESAGK